MINNIILQHTKHFFVKNQGDKCLVLLYYPHKQFKPLPNDYAFVSPHYVAYTGLYALRNKLLEALKDYNPVKFEGNFKKLFVDSGVGIYLKSNLIAIPPFGTRVSLQAIILEGNFEERLLDLTNQKEFCKSCNNCRKNCPVNALEDGFEPSKCLRYQMNDYKNSNSDFTLLDGGLLGCEHCQRGCPYNAFVEFEDTPNALRELLKIDWLLDTAKKGKEALRPLAAFVGANYTNPHRIQFFALNAIKDKKTAQLAVEYLNDPDEVLRQKAKDILKRHDLQF